MRSKEVLVRITATKKDFKKTLLIRKIVFVKEQKVAEAEEWDGLDDEAKHFLATYKDEPIACARIRFMGKKAKLERIAVLKKYRKKGIGKALVTYMISYCRRRKISKAIMHAQTHALGFYHSLGFKASGKVFLEANIPHVKMQMRL